MAFSEIAYRALQDIVGKEHVTNDPLMCQAYSRVQWTPDGVIQREQILKGDCASQPGTEGSV